MSTALTRQSDVVATSVARNISQFRSAVSESFVPLQVTSPLADSFRGMIKSASIDEVHVTDVRAAEYVVVTDVANHRPRRQIVLQAEPDAERHGAARSG